MNNSKPFNTHSRCWQLCVLAALGLLMIPAWSDSLDRIVARGTLVVGVKSDVPLWGFKNKSTGLIQGLEPDLAQDLARRLGVKVELVGLLTADRLDAVNKKRVDVLIATLSDTPDRRAQLNLVSPHYYASGVNVLARRSDGFRQWTDLKNRRICGRRGAFYNRPIIVTYQLDVVRLYGNELAKSALRDGRCSAFLYDDTGILAMMTDPAWGEQFEMPLPTLYITPWSIALHADERGGRLDRAVSNAIISWHRDGFLKELEARWAIPPSQFVSAMHQRWRKPPTGTALCGEQVSPTTPAECL
jgi:polar amino acid transport system substrate-binding protein